MAGNTKQMSEVNCLPLGIKNADGTLDSSIEIKDWDMQQEIELGEKLSKIMQSGSVVDYVTAILSQLCSRIGPHDFEKLSTVEKAVIIGQMYLPDVFYAFMKLRIETMGNTLEMEIKCPSCKRTKSFLADLNTLDVRCVDTFEEACFEYEMKTPINIRDNEVSKLVLGPSHWSVMKNISGNENPNAMKCEMILGSIKKINENENVVLVLNELYPMKKPDIEGVVSIIDDESIGPDLSIQDTCSCGNKINQSIDWTDKNFFGVSSR